MTDSQVAPKKQKKILRKASQASIQEKKRGSGPAWIHKG